MATTHPRLSLDAEDTACELAAMGATMQLIAQTLGLKSAGQLAKYRKQHPDFEENFVEALATNNLKLEEELLELPLKHDKDVAKLLSDNIKWLLGVRDKDRYSPRQQHDVSVHIDISGALDRASERAALVTNVIPLLAKKRDKDDE